MGVLLYFNSTKVQFGGDNNVHLIMLSDNFNSTKVQFGDTDARRDWSRSSNFNSTKVQFGDVCLAARALRDLISIPLRYNLEGGTPK